MQSTGKVLNFKNIRQANLNSPSRKKPKILFVDDEERILNTMQALFRRQYDTTTTTDGYQALKLLQQDHYQLLVSDQRMPIMAGVDLLREAKKVSPGTMRILLTGYSDLTAIIGSVNEGEVFRFLNKPWSTQEFVSTVDEAVKIGLELQEAANDTPVDLISPPENKGTAVELVAESTEPMQVIAAAPRPAQADSVAEGNMIILRGDSELLAMVRGMLPGCQIFTANDHEAAIDLMMAHEIGVIVSNVNEDQEEALEFFSLLKNEHPQVVSILLADSGDSATIIHLINHARVFRYMFKPIRERMMKRYLHSAFEQYQQFKVKPTLLKQQQTQKKPLPTSDNNLAATEQAAADNIKNIPLVVKNNTNILGKMRKIRSFFSRLVSG